jgi:hypothetical protein
MTQVTGVYDRYSYFVTDTHGNDPLTSKLNNRLSEIKTLSTYTITTIDECRPDNLALKLLGTSDLWWLLMEYNALSSINDLRTGVVLNIPDSQGITTILVKVKGVKQANRTISVK